jgi:Protein of unknown function (DUF3592)
VSPFASLHSAEQHRGMALVKGAILTIASVVMVVIGLRAGWEARLLARRGLVTTGQITSCWGSARGRDSIKISYVFDANGRVQEVEGRRSTLQEAVPRGETVRVTYDPQDPSRCVSDLESGSASRSWFVLGLGVVAGIAGVFAIVSAMRAGAA